MSKLDNFLLEIEAREQSEEMYFSLYFIPQSYNPENNYHKWQKNILTS